MTEEKRLCLERFNQIKAYADSGTKELPEEFHADEVDSIYFELCAIHAYNTRGKRSENSEQTFIDRYFSRYFTRKRGLKRAEDEAERLLQMGLDKERLRSKLAKPYAGSYSDMLADLFRLIHKGSGEQEPVTARAIMQQCFPVIWTGGQTQMTLEEKQDILLQTGFDPWKGEKTA